MARKKVTEIGTEQDGSKEVWNAIPGKVCSICLQPSFDTSSGNTCPNHHGGAAMIDQSPTFQLPAPPATAVTRLVDALLQPGAFKNVDSLFESPNKAKEQPMDDRMVRLADDTFAPLDWDAIFDEYEQWLELGDKRTSEPHIRLAHERGPGIVRRITLVWIQIREARTAWEKKNDVIFGAMREQATDVLQAEKNAKARSKTITEADVRLKAAELFPDEWQSQETQRKRYELVEERAKHDMENAILRVHVLETMMKRLH
jgi:hypothetical protein